MTELKPRIHDKSNGLDYVLVGDYYVPDLSYRRNTALSVCGADCTGHIWSSTALQGSLPSVYPANCILTLLTWTNRQRKDAALSLSR